MSAYRRSRCVDEANAPQHLHWAVIENDPHLVQRELVDALKAHVKPGDQLHALADVRATLETIERCSALEPSQVEAVRRDAALFELKLSFKTWGVLLRIYETEDAQLPHHIVALRSHQKVVVPEHEISVRQDREIDIASRRLVRGRHDLWGLRPA